MGLKVFAGWVLAIFGIVVLIGSISALAYMLWIGFKFFVDLSNDPDYDDKRTGLANDGDDWSPFPCAPLAKVIAGPRDGVGECFDCGGPISPEKGCPACGLPPLARPDIEQQVCQDILDRQKLGVAKYGTTVAENPLELRAWLQHALEECLDQAIYLKRAIAAIDEEAGK
jgi:hypothetical protein